MSDGNPVTMHIKILTPGHMLAEADVEAVALPSLEGEIGVLPGHMPLFVALGKGKIRTRRGVDEESYPVRGGYAQIQPDGIIVMTEAGEDEGGSGA
jgi:F-type H+-transporting ATPase subunit epsilon